MCAAGHDFPDDTVLDGPVRDADDGAPTASYAERLAVAEAQVEALADSFESWARGDLAALQVALQGAGQMSRRRQEFDRIFQVAHDMKGQGSTFGYNLLTEIAGSLCDFLRRLTDPTDADLVVVRHHVSALNVVLEQRIKGSGGELGQQIIARLRQLTEPDDDRPEPA